MAGIGEALRSTRERRGLSIDQVAQDTRISPRFLEALEAEQFHELPAPVYVRGFLRSYANYLHIEAQPLLDRLIGGDMAMPGATTGYVGANGRNGTNGKTPRRPDPFQRGGVVAAAPPLAPPRAPRIPAAAPLEPDTWAPEPPGPFTPPHEDHGYIPGSDLMEAPEYVEYPVEEEQPVFPRRRNTGVLAERPPISGEPGVPRKALVFGGAVIAVIAFLALAVLATRDGGDGSNTADADNGGNPGATPGTIIPVGGAASTATAAAAASSSPAASTSPNASTTTSPTATGSTTPGPTATPGAGTPTATATVTPTTAAAATQAPTATPTQVPPTATPVPQVFPENRAFAECTPTDGSYDCGAPPYRVICYAPLGFPLNQNWWVDVDRSFGSLPPGWKEFDGLLSNGQIIKAGQSDCATP